MQPYEDEKHSTATVEHLLAVGRRHAVPSYLASATRQSQRAVGYWPRARLCVEQSVGLALVRRGKRGVVTTSSILVVSWSER